MNLFIEVATVLVDADFVAELADGQNREPCLQLLAGMDDGVLPGDPTRTRMAVQALACAGLVVRVGGELLAEFWRDVVHAVAA